MGEEIGGGEIRYTEYSARHLGDLLPMWRASFERAVGITDPHPLEEQRAYFLREVVPNYYIRVATAE